MRLVCESLYEFQRGQDPMKTLELGGKLQQIKDWLSPYLFSSQYKVNSDYTIDVVRGDFIAIDQTPEIPEYVKFNICKGSFIISGQGFKDLFGCPRIVEKDFIVSANKIVSLNGSPEIVMGSYVINNNPGNFTVDDVRKVCDVKGKIWV